MSLWTRNILYPDIVPDDGKVLCLAICHFQISTPRAVVTFNDRDIAVVTFNDRDIQPDRKKKNGGRCLARFVTIKYGLHGGRISVQRSSL